MPPLWSGIFSEPAEKCYPRRQLGRAQLVELETTSSLELVINSRTDPVMNFWSFYISQSEIETAALDLIERHGEGAREEAIRLADVGRRLDSARNSAIFRRAARYLASDRTGVEAARRGLERSPVCSPSSATPASQLKLRLANEVSEPTGDFACAPAINLESADRGSPRSPERRRGPDHADAVCNSVQTIGDRREFVVQLAANGGQGGDGDDRDQRCDEAIFNGGSARLIFNETGEKRLHYALLSNIF